MHHTVENMYCTFVRSHLASGANSSLIMSHGTGPNPRAKKNMKRAREVTGRKARPVARVGDEERRKK